MKSCTPGNFPRPPAARADLTCGVPPPATLLTVPCPPDREQATRHSAQTAAARLRPRLHPELRGRRHGPAQGQQPAADAHDERLDTVSEQRCVGAVGRGRVAHVLALLEFRLPTVSMWLSFTAVKACYCWS